MPQVFNYDSFKTANYEKDFWQDNRGYEDLAERLALKKLLPKNAEWFIDIGTGFGRLADLYAADNQNVVLFDCSESLLKQARERLLKRGLKNIYFVLGNVYNLPFAQDVFGGGVMVRVAHHLEDIQKVLAGLNKAFKPQSHLVLEYPNKRNLLEILRFVCLRSKLNPFSHAPSRRGDLYYNYHPRYLSRLLQETGWAVKKERGVSFFRIPILKKIINFKLLAYLDLMLQVLLGKIKLSPSVFLLLQNIKKETKDRPPILVGGSLTSFNQILDILCCPDCGGRFNSGENVLKCISCDSEYRVQDGIYDCRVP